jgi:hypothetical protein
MLRTVKASVLFAICIFFATLSQSQITLKPPTLSPLPGDIKNLVADYPNRFAAVLGEEIAKNPQSTDYKCSAKITGAENSVITLYSSASGNKCSWSAEMLVTENFEEAKKKYKSLYTQLNNIQVSNESGAFHLKGKYDEPTEAKKFAGSVLSPDKIVNGYTALRLEVSLQYELLEWKVKLLLYGKEREDNERGKTTE